VPIYEYRCGNCDKRSTVFARSMTSDVHAKCSHCDSEDMTKLPSTFGYQMSGKTVKETNAPRPPKVPDMDYYSDPGNIGKNVEHTFDKAGMDVPGSIREKIDAARQGKMPKELGL